MRRRLGLRIGGEGGNEGPAKIGGDADAGSEADADVEIEGWR